MSALLRPNLRSLKPSIRRGSATKLRKLTLRCRLSEPTRVRTTLRGRSVTANVAAGNASRTYRLTLRLS